MGKKELRVIIKLSVLLVLVAIFLAINHSKAIPDNETNDSEQHSIILTDLDSITQFTIKGGRLNLAFSHQGQWMMEGESAPLNQKAIEETAYILSKLWATEQLERQDYTDFGFNPANYTINFVDGQFNSYRLKLGQPIPSGDGYYAMINDDDKIYIVNLQLVNYLLASENHYLDQTIAPINFELVTHLTISNQHGTIKLIESNDKIFTRFTFIEPYPSFGIDSYRFNDQFLMKWRALFPFIKANIIPHPTNLSHYGLAVPSASLIFTDQRQQSLSLLIGNEADPGISYYAKLANDRAVFTIDSTLAEQAITTKAFDWLDKFVSLEDINAISSVNFLATNFNLEGHYSTTDDQSTYFLNQQLTDEATFKSYYQQFLTIFYEGVAAMPASNEIAYQMIFTFKNGQKRLVDYHNYDEQFYRVAINQSITPFLVGQYQLDELFKQSKKIVNGAL